MRLRTLPLSLAGVVCGGVMAYVQPACRPGTHIFLILTGILLQILSNLSNEMGDYKNGVDNDDRQGPSYGMANGLSEKQLWLAINVTVVACAISGLLMLLFSFNFSLSTFHFWCLLLLGAAAIWAATHYTLGKNPYGYRGLGDFFVFVFFGLVSVLGSYFVIAHTIAFRIWLVAPAVGLGFLSVAVLNVNNIRDMVSDKGVRMTIPLRIGLRNARIYQTLLVALGATCFYWCGENLWMCGICTIPFFLLHIIGVWRREGKRLDPMLPLLVITTFVLCVLYGEIFFIESTSPYPIW